MRSRARLAFALLLAALAAAGCREEAGDGEFALDGKLFVFNYRVATATYLVNIVPRGAAREGDTAVASFEDPAGGPPIIVRQKIWPKLARTTIESPPVSCIAKDKPYAVTIRIEGADGKERQRIETTMTSDVDQDVLPDRPLVVGPVYTPNPELAGHSDGKLPGARPDCPARG